MRVATRRLRAALSLFADALPASSTKLREELGWLGGVLGAVRDLDVQLEQLDEWPAALPEADRQPLDALRLLLDEAARRRTDGDARRARLAEVPDLRRRFGRMLRSERMTALGPVGGARLGRLRADLIESRFRPFRKAANRIGPARAGGLPPAADPLQAVAVRARVSRRRLPGTRAPAGQAPGRAPGPPGAPPGRRRRDRAAPALAVERGSELPPATVFAMGEIAERYRRDGESSGRGSRPRTPRTKGKGWKALQKEIEVHRPAWPAVIPSVTCPRRPERRSWSGLIDVYLVRHAIAEHRDQAAGPTTPCGRSRPRASALPARRPRSTPDRPATSTSSSRARTPGPGRRPRS